MTNRPSARLRSLLAAGVLPLLLMSGQVQAQGFAWMQNSPVRGYTDADWEMVRTTMEGLLNTGKDGDKADWENPETSHSGSFELLDRSEMDGRPCRRTRITNRGRGMTSTGIFNLCQNAAGEWLFAPSQ